MTDKEKAAILRNAANIMAVEWGEYTQEEAFIINLADELDPPRPERGLVFYGLLKGEDGHPGWWDGEKLRDCETGVLINLEKCIGMKPPPHPNILAPDEVVISKRTACAILGEYSYHNIGINTVFATDARDELRTSLTRAEAERMEEDR